MDKMRQVIKVFLVNKLANHPPQTETEDRKDKTLDGVTGVS